ncbi:hypothetical protein MJT46_016756 [Ovis ammon polii x Ovis aries]|nr:hypothetical protein MJT46_016756 [Ovis ammon polii x Ovis aries]
MAGDCGVRSDLASSKGQTRHVTWPPGKGQPAAFPRVHSVVSDLAEPLAPASAESPYLDPGKGMQLSGHEVVVGRLGHDPSSRALSFQTLALFQEAFQGCLALVSVVGANRASCELSLGDRERGPAGCKYRSPSAWSLTRPQGKLLQGEAWDLGKEQPPLTAAGEGRTAAETRRRQTPMQRSTTDA